MFSIYSVFRRHLYFSCRLKVLGLRFCVCGTDEFFQVVGEHFRRPLVAFGGKVYAVFGGPSVVEPVFHAAYAAHGILPRPEHGLSLPGDAPLHLLDFGQADGACAAYAERVFQGFGCADDEDAGGRQAVADLADGIQPFLFGVGNVDVVAEGFVGTVGKDD